MEVTLSALLGYYGQTDRRGAADKPTNWRTNELFQQPRDADQAADKMDFKRNGEREEARNKQTDHGSEGKVYFRDAS